MPLIDLIKQMQQQGFSEQDIVARLSEQGYSPKDINYTIEQSKIKKAVEEPVAPVEQVSMQPSMMSQNQEQMPMLQQNQQQDYTYQTPQAYPQDYQYYQPQQGISTETITEISEQIVAEKLSDLRKAISSIADFKMISESKISNIDERLKRIESIIDNLQAKILGKIGSYGQSVQDMKSEIEAMQDSFGKVINPLVDRARKFPQSSQQQSSQQTQQVQDKRKKGKQDFSDYLRE